MRTDILGGSMSKDTESSKPEQRAHTRYKIGKVDWDHVVVNTEYQ